HYLEVHRRAPEEIGGSGSRGRLAQEAIVELGGIHVVVLERDPGIRRPEVLDQRADDRGVGGRVDDELPFLLGGAHHARVGGSDGSGKDRKREEESCSEDAAGHRSSISGAPGAQATRSARPASRPNRRRTLTTGS